MRAEAIPLRSVSPTPHARTETRTSFGPTLGTGTSRSSSGRAGPVRTMAFMSGRDVDGLGLREEFARGLAPLVRARAALLRAAERHVVLGRGGLHVHEHDARLGLVGEAMRPREIAREQRGREPE